MPEVAVAFPNDETTAEVIASRLRVDGIAARVDLGSYGSTRMVPPGGQITVLVDSIAAARAHKILGTTPRAAKAPSSFERLAVVFLRVAVVVGIVAIVVLALTR